MKVGDLVRDCPAWCAEDAFGEKERFGIVVELQDVRVVPPSALIMWQSGELGKEWADDIEVVD
jgi:hypothetical protein